MDDISDPLALSDCHDDDGVDEDHLEGVEVVDEDGVNTLIIYLLKFLTINCIHINLLGSFFIVAFLYLF